jgi:hypothetical protein
MKKKKVNSSIPTQNTKKKKSPSLSSSYQTRENKFSLSSVLLSSLPKKTRSKYFPHLLSFPLFSFLSKKIKKSTFVHLWMQNDKNDIKMLDSYSGGIRCRSKAQITFLNFLAGTLDS